MTALIYRLEPELVMLAMDSLVTYPDLRPMKYCTKMFPLIHLGGVMLGTGIGNFALAWHCKIHSQIVAKDMEYLNILAPKELPKIFKEVVGDLKQDVSSTIYHFGVDQKEKIMVGYAYKSENNFMSERLVSDTLGFKPENETLKTKSYKLTGPVLTRKDIIEFMSEQKMLVENKYTNIDKKVGIGGEVHLLIMNNKGEIFFSSCHKFDDYSKMFTEMLANIQHVQ